MHAGIIEVLTTFTECTMLLLRFLMKRVYIKKSAKFSYAASEEDLREAMKRIKETLEKYS